MLYLLISLIASLSPFTHTTTGPVYEDSFGWNCFVDGDWHCGDTLSVNHMAGTPKGCITDPAYMYTMCPDGLVIGYKAEMKGYKDGMAVEPNKGTLSFTYRVAPK